MKRSLLLSTLLLGLYSSLTAAATQGPQIATSDASAFLRHQQRNSNLHDTIQALGLHEDEQLRKEAEAFFLRLAKNRAEHPKRVEKAYAALRDRTARAGKMDANAQKAYGLLNTHRGEEFSFMSAMDPAKDKALLAAYQIADSLHQESSSLETAKSLSKTTTADVHEAFDDSSTPLAPGMPSLGSLARLMRPLPKIGFGTAPFMRTVASSERGKQFIPTSEVELDRSFPQQNKYARALGAANLGALALDHTYKALTQQDVELALEEAEALAHANYTNGVMPEVTSYKEFMKTTAKIRKIVQIFGQGILPALTFLVAGNQKNFSPAMAIGNASGVIDSLFGIAQRYRTRRLIKAIKEVMPALKQHLIDNPPSAEERAANTRANRTREHINAMNAMSANPFMLDGLGGQAAL